MLTDRLAPYFAVLSKINPDGRAQAAGGGLTIRCPFPERHRNGDRSPSLRVYPGRDGNLMARCLGCGAAWAEIVRAVGTDPADWFPPRGTVERDRRMDAARPREVARFDYRAAGQDIHGQPYAVKVRLEPGYHGERKTFQWWRPLPGAATQIDLPAGVECAATGPEVLAGGTYVLTGRHPRRWVFRRSAESGPPAAAGCPVVSAPPLTPGLYHAEVLARVAANVPVFVVEGEGKARTLRRLGFCAAAPPHGAGKWHAGLSLPLAGRPVIVVPDNDRPGLAHADLVAGSLARHGVRQLRVWEPGRDGFDVPADGDIDDWLLEFPDDRARREAVERVSRRCRRLTLTRGEQA